MKDTRLKARLTGVARRQACLRAAKVVALGWLGLAALALALGWMHQSLGFGSPWTLPGLGLVAVGLAAGLGWREWRRPVSLREAAASVEQAFPDLQGLVLTAVQQQPDEQGEWNVLQRRVMDRAVAHDGQQDWRTVVPDSRIGVACLFPLAAGVMLLAMLWLNYVPPQRRAEIAARRSVERSGVEVTPGDALIEKGESLVVLARFGGALPPGAEMVYRMSNGREQRVKLTRNLKDPVFGGSLSEVGEDLAYRIEYAGKSTKEFQVRVFEHPRLERADAELTYPEYTHLAVKRIEDTKRISAVEATRVSLTLNLNKAVASAQLISRVTNVPALTLQVFTNRAVALLPAHVLERSASYDLRLVDAEGRSNKVASTFVFEAVKNRIPEMKLASPRGDIKPSALEEVHFEGTVWDDFGILSYGIAYSVSDGEVRSIDLGTNVAAQVKTPFVFELKLEDLKVRPDQLLAWFVWADDLGPDGQLRRNQGDMFYAEVRPFETVFREGQGGGGEGEGGEKKEGATKKLGELQMQILNATWKLLREYPAGRGGKPATDAKPDSKLKPGGASGEKSRRAGVTDGVVSAEFRERWLRLRPGIVAQVPKDSAGPAPRERPRRLESTDARPGATPKRNLAAAAPVSFETDLQVIRDAMETAIEQAQESRDQQQDPKLQALWSTVVTDLETAAKQLEAAKTPADLKEALKAQKAAKEDLAKLRERETQVQRGKKSSSSNSDGEQASDRQIEQLDLEQSKDRYETQRQAQAAKDPQQREQQQVLNRLAELARRQQDVNSKLKELQAALQEARTEAEKEAARRQLKRLEEEQKQMLADADELQQRMNREENQSRMSEQRRQLEQTRNELQQSAEASGDGQVGKALSAGTRAQRQLQEMRENLRKKNANELAEELRDLRAESREIARKQAEISKGLETPAEKGGKSLSAPDPSDALAKLIAEQRSRMTNLMTRATEISERAEASEPLVSRQLYDALRKFATDDTSNVKRMREQLAREGVLSKSGDARLKEIAEGSGAKSLQTAEEFLQRGGREIARGINQAAAKDIETLNRGVERATESVLGDDTEALRLARQELDALTDQLQKEIAQNRGTNSAKGGKPGAGERTPGQQAGGQGNPGRNRPGGGTNAAVASASGGGKAAPNGEKTPAEAGEEDPSAAASNAAAQPGANGPGTRPGDPKSQQASRNGAKSGKPSGTPSPTGSEAAEKPDPDGQSEQAGADGAPESPGEKEPTDPQGQPGQQGKPGQRGQKGQPGQRAQSGQSGQPGDQGEPGQPGEQAQQGQPGQGQPGQGQPGQGQPGQGQPGQGQPGQGQPGQPGQQSGSGGQARANAARSPQRRLGGERPAGQGQEGDLANVFRGGPEKTETGGGPITGGNFSEWSDRLRDVEEMVDQADLRNEVASARDRAREMRTAFRRDGKKPDWATMELKVMGPLVEVRTRISEELARRGSRENLVPIDRDPVPTKYAELVRRYYEQLGKEKP